MFELTVKVKDSDRKYSRSFPCPEHTILSPDAVFIKDCIETTLVEFASENDRPETVRIVIKSEDL